MKKRKLFRPAAAAAVGAAVMAAILCAGCTTQTENPEAPVQTEPSKKPTPAEPSAPEPDTGELPTETIRPFPDELLESETSRGETEETETSDSGKTDGEIGEKTMVIATDIHYLSPSLTDGGSGFQYMVEHGDGKVMPYIEEITDAFVEAMIQKQPDVVILSGDLTFNGEKKSHEELAQKLQQIEDAGVSVVVIPGNHDINNHQASEFRGEKRLPAEFTSVGEFLSIYRPFGYQEAISRDRSTLSYVYELDEKTRLLMLDTCQYRQWRSVGGAILSDTYDWIDEQLEQAWDEGVNLIPVAHHNLLDQSEIYVEDCTIEHSEQLVERLEDWDVPLFLSGHLHVQHSKQSRTKDGIWEMVTGSLATPECQYGVLKFGDDKHFSYETETLDMERWARKHGQTEEELLNFNEFQESFLKRVFYNQSYDALQALPDLNESERRRMSEVYCRLNYSYYQGTACEIRDEVLADPDYQLWQDEGYATVLADYVEYILSDAVKNYTRMSRE